MISRMAEAPSLRRTLAGLRRYRHLLRNLVLKDLKLKYRGSVDRFPVVARQPAADGRGLHRCVPTILRIRDEGFVFYLMLGSAGVDVFRELGRHVDWFDRRQRRAGQERVVPAGDPADGHRALQPHPVPPQRVGDPAADAHLLPRDADSADAALPGLRRRCSCSSRSASRSSLATATAFLRDVRHLVEIAITILFWMTPIVYELRELAEPRSAACSSSARCRPMWPRISRSSSTEQWPDAAIWITTIGYAAAALALGLWLIVRNEDQLRGAGLTWRPIDPTR